MLEHATMLRLLPFLAILGVMMVWETLAPRRERASSRRHRTINNLLLTAVNSLVVKFIPILSAVAAARWAQSEGWGLLNLTAWPQAVEYGLAIVVFDLLIYWQHVASHHIPMLWRFHQVHHADHDLDASSGLRFHPVEIAFSMVVKCVGAIVLGPAPAAVLLFEVVLNGCALFNHSNLKLPLTVDHWLRWVLVTPDMHRIHHSVEQDETDSNYGFNIPWWDRLFRTYRAQPRGDHRSLKLGVPGDSERRVEGVWVMLAMPWTAPHKIAAEEEGECVNPIIGHRNGSTRSTSEAPSHA